MSVTWAGTNGPYTRGGVASCLTWGPETRKDITITRPNEHWYQRTNTLPPAAVNHHHRGVTSLDSTEKEREKVHEAIADKIAGERKRVERKFDRNVVAAVHSSAEPVVGGGYHHNPRPPPPPTRDDRLRGAELRQGFRGGMRKVLIAEEGAPVVPSSQPCCRGASCSKCCYTCTDEPPAHLSTYQDTSRSLAHHLSPTRSLAHHLSPTRSLAHHQSPTRSLVHHTSPSRSYSTLDYEPVPVSTYTAEYSSQPVGEEFRMSRRDFMKHREQLAQLRNTAAEERKELMMIYQSVKADEKFHGASPQQWRSISPKLSEIENMTKREREELDHYNRIKQQEQEEKRQRIQEKYERAKHVRLSSLDRGRYGYGGSRGVSPELNRSLNCSSPVSDYRTQTYQTRIKGCCSSPTCSSSCTTSRCSSPVCYDSDTLQRTRHNSVRGGVTYGRCDSPQCDQWKPNVTRSQMSYYTPSTWDSKPPLPAMSRSRTIHNNTWSPRVYERGNRLTRSQSFSSDGRRHSQTGWQTLREPDSTGHRQLTLYNPGRLTPVGSYTQYNGRDYHVGGAYSRPGEEADDTKVKVKLDCQPNSDTLVSFRVQSRQV